MCRGDDFRPDYKKAAACQITTLTYTHVGLLSWLHSLCGIEPTRAENNVGSDWRKRSTTSSHVKSSIDLQPSNVGNPSCFINVDISLRTCCRTSALKAFCAAGPHASKLRNARLYLQVRAALDTVATLAFRLELPWFCRIFLSTATKHLQQINASVGPL